MEIREFFQALCGVGVEFKLGPRDHVARASLFSQGPVEGTRVAKSALGGARPLQAESGLSRKGEDQEIALAGDDHGEEAAVGGDGKVAEGEAVKKGIGGRLRNGNLVLA